MLDRRRAFGPMLLLSVTAGFLLYIHAVSYMLDSPMGDGLMMLEVALTAGYVAPVMPLLCALPFGSGFCQDIQDGYAIPVLVRSGKGVYFGSKILCCALSGGLCAALSMGAFAAFAHLLWPSDFSTPRMMELAHLQSLLAIPGPGGYLLYYLARMGLVFLSGAFWALCALCFSAFFPSLSLALVSPLVLWRLAMALNDGNILPYWLNPAMLDDGMAPMQPLMLMLSALGLYLSLCAALGLLFAWRGERRLCHGG